MLSIAWTAFAQSGHTVLDGAFTAAQAKRGEAEYAANCAECHEGADVDGPSLEGTPFIERWREDDLDVLFTYLKTRMPADKPGKLSDEVYIDVLAHLLQRNDYPAGATELTAEKLGATKLVGKDGPKPLPTNALVQVAGCLTAGVEGAWNATNATEPVRTLTADEITAQETAAAGRRPLGSQTYRLQRLNDVSGFVAESHKGQKVLAKGVLVRQGENVRINVTAIAPVAPNCP